MGIIRKALASRPVASLTSPYSIDHYLDQIHPMLAAENVRAKVVEVVHETGDASTVVLRPNGAWNGFTPGQHVQFGVEVDGKRRVRVFSVSSSRQQSSCLQEQDVQRLGQGASRRLRVAVPAQRPQARHDRLPLAGRGRVRPPARDPRQRAPDERRLRHHAGHVDDPYAPRLRPHRPRHVPALRPIARGRDVQRRARRDRRHAPPGAGRPHLHPQAGRRRRAQGPLHDRPPQAPRHRPDGDPDVRLRSCRAHRQRA